MRLLLFLFFILSFSILSFSQQFEEKYAIGLNTPEWVSLMYAEDPDIGEVVKAFKDYYSIYPFEKNKHTQYYKRWIRNISRDVNGLNSGGKVSIGEVLKNEAE